MDGKTDAERAAKLPAWFNAVTAPGSTWIFSVPYPSDPTIKVNQDMAVKLEVFGVLGESDRKMQDKRLNDLWKTYGWQPAKIQFTSDADDPGKFKTYDAK